MSDVSFSDEVVRASVRTRLSKVPHAFQYVGGRVPWRVFFYGGKVTNHRKWEKVCELFRVPVDENKPACVVAIVLGKKMFGSELPTRIKEDEEFMRQVTQDAKNAEQNGAGDDTINNLLVDIITEREQNGNPII